MMPRGRRLAVESRALSPVRPTIAVAAAIIKGNPQGLKRLPGHSGGTRRHSFYHAVVGVRAYGALPPSPPGTTLSKVWCGLKDSTGGCTVEAWYSAGTPNARRNSESLARPGRSRPVPHFRKCATCSHGEQGPRWSYDDDQKWFCNSSAPPPRVRVIPHFRKCATCSHGEQGPRLSYDTDQRWVR